MIELNSKMRFDTAERGQGLFIRSCVKMFAWQIHKTSVLESPLSFGNVNFGGEQFDVGRIGAFTFINGRPHNRFNYRPTNIDAQSIGRFCMIAQDVQIGVGGHPVNAVSSSAVFSGGNAWTENFYSDLRAKDWLDEITPKYKNALSNKRQIPLIGNDVWIGAGVTIQNGVTIGDGVIIAAGAMVVKDVPPYTIVGGVPAEPIRQRFDDKTVELLIQSKWWEYGADIMVCIDMYKPYEAAQQINERIEGGFPKFKADVFEFNWENNTIHRVTDSKRKFYGYIDKI